MSLLSILFFGSAFLFRAAIGDLVTIDAGNHDEVMQNSRLAFVMFGASWCPFSRNLKPSFTEAAVEYKKKYPDRKTVWGSVDCVAQEALAQKYAIGKFPTMKVFFYGYMMTEYRASRQVNALIEYVEKMENTSSLVNLHPVQSITQWQTAAVEDKGTLILWFPRNSPPFELILKAIALIHDRLTVVVPVESNDLQHEEHQLWFSLDGHHVKNFEGNVASFKEIVEWVQRKSVGMVRELTFSNAEEIVEDRKPMLILFRNVEDKQVEKKFVQAIRRELNETLLSAINPLLADGQLMSNVLAHFRRTPQQLPFLIIDQFVHSYPAPWEGDEIFAEGNIKKFVLDLFNDNHHKRLHQKVDELLKKMMFETEKVEQAALGEPSTTTANEESDKKDSVFNKLQPAGNRYSFSKLEL